MPRFSLGHVVMTRGVQTSLDDITELYNLIFLRHAEGDWGDLDEHDVKVNEEALASGDRLFSAYHLANGTKLYIITE